MALKDTLQERIHTRDIRHICARCNNETDSSVKEDLYALIFDPDPRVAYNAMWVFTHFSPEGRLWLLPRREALIDHLLSTSHVGQQRMLLTILDQLPDTKAPLRTDYLDFCLSKINSREPYAVRALSLKQAFICCRTYPELMRELIVEIEMMECHTLSPGLKSVRRNILKKITTCKTAK